MDEHYNSFFNTILNQYIKPTRKSLGQYLRRDIHITEIIAMKEEVHEAWTSSMSILATRSGVQSIDPESNSALKWAHSQMLTIIDGEQQWINTQKTSLAFFRVSIAQATKIAQIFQGRLKALGAGQADEDIKKINELWIGELKTSVGGHCQWIIDNIRYWKIITVADVDEVIQNQITAWKRIVEMRADLISRGMYSDTGHWTEHQLHEHQKIAEYIEHQLTRWNNGEILITRVCINGHRNRAMALYIYVKRMFYEAATHFYMEGVPKQSQEYWDSRKYYWEGRKLQRQNVWEKIRLLARGLNKRI